MVRKAFWKVLWENSDRWHWHSQFNHPKHRSIWDQIDWTHYQLNLRNLKEKRTFPDSKYSLNFRLVEVKERQYQHRPDRYDFKQNVQEARSEQSFLRIRSLLENSWRCSVNFDRNPYSYFVHLTLHWAFETSAIRTTRSISWEANGDISVFIRNMGGRTNTSPCSMPSVSKIQTRIFDYSEIFSYPLKTRILDPNCKYCWPIRRNWIFISLNRPTGPSLKLLFDQNSSRNPYGFTLNPDIQPSQNQTRMCDVRPDDKR